MQINSTELAGVFAFAPPTFAAIVAFGQASRNKYSTRRSWAVIALVYAILCVEVLARTRYVIGDEIRDFLRQNGVYSERRPVQAATLLVLVVFAALIAIYFARSAANRAHAIASASAVVVIALFFAESVSLHAVDGILYARAGPVLLIGWLWLACGWFTTAAAAAQAARVSASRTGDDHVSARVSLRSRPPTNNK